jgi:hypothetical protein
MFCFNFHLKNLEELYLYSNKIKKLHSYILSDLKNNKHHSIKLQRSYNKYGAEAFEYLVIYESLDYETAVNLELAMIKAFYGKMLLNSSANSKGFYKGYKHTSESRAKISKALLGNKYTLGYKHTEEAKQKQRNASKGNPTRFKPLSAYIKDGITYLGSIEASIKTNIPRTTLYEIDDTHKIIVLATILFLFFSDNKVRNYVMTILVVIFGDMLKTQAGGISKIGLVAYSVVYGLSLFVLVNLIEIVIDKYL